MLIVAQVSSQQIRWAIRGAPQSLRGSPRRVLVVLLALVLSVCPAAVAQRLAESTMSKTDIFRSGEGGYEVYRIPGLVVTAKGTLLAYAEARKYGSSDWGAIDIVLRRGTGGGKSWSKPKVIAKLEGALTANLVAPPRGERERSGLTYNNPVAITSREPGVVHFLFCLEYMRAFYMRSTDDGRTFSRPVEITGAFQEFRKDYAWKVIATGPGHGIELKNGRLVVPVWLSLGTGGNAHRPSVTSVIYSDDGGATWHGGEIAVPHLADWVNPSEAAAVQLADGRVMLNVRTESKPNRRVVTISADGATRWSEPRFQEDLAEPVCFGSITRLSGAGDGRADRLLFVNPDNLSVTGREEKPGAGRDRKNLTVRLSRDEGATWPVKRAIEPGSSGYADLGAARDGRIFVFYERGVAGAAAFRIEALTLAVFDLDWLTQGKERMEDERWKRVVWHDKRIR
ncbi:MAG: glycoside hydrolase [Bryobacterales bacterium]|nr:glycoside hydrolase [Bryobacterales bacterium]